jgi:hypothetical protein
MSPRLQKFPSSFAARVYWKMTSSTSEYVELARAEAFDGCLDVVDQLHQLLLVMGDHRFPARCEDRTWRAHSELDRPVGLPVAGIGGAIADATRPLGSGMTRLLTVGSTSGSR